MSGCQPERLSREPLNLGLSVFAPISSVAGSPSLLFAQPLLTGSVFASTALLIGSELFLLIARRLFNLSTIPVLDAKNGQTVQMPIAELQEFLKWMATGTGSGAGTSPNSSPAPDVGSGEISSNPPGQTSGMDNTGFITNELQATLTIAIYFSAFYSNNPFTPSISFFIPILSFPGARGALPLLILGLLSTIFVRAVVSPESTGSRPLATPTPKINNPQTYSPNDLLQMLTKFGKIPKQTK